MACPAPAAALMAAALPPGPALELCCGAGGITRELARTGRRVLAVDQNQARLRANRENLAAVGLEGRVAQLCCDLRRAALRRRPGAKPFAAAVLDPDWSPPGRPPREWANALSGLEPPLGDLLELALSLAPLAMLRLPRALARQAAEELAPGLTVQELAPGGRRWQWLWLARGAGRGQLTATSC